MWKYHKEGEFNHIGEADVVKWLAGSTLKSAKPVVYLVAESHVIGWIIYLINYWNGYVKK